MISKTHSFTIDQLIGAWAYENRDSSDLYKSQPRVDLLEMLADKVLLDNYELIDLLPYKNKIIDVIVTEDGKKFSKKKGHKYYHWLQNAQKDLMSVIENYQTNLDDLNGPGYLSNRGEIKDWVQGTFGTKDKSLTKEAHRLLGPMLTRFCNEILIK